MKQNIRSIETTGGDNYLTKKDPPKIKTDKVDSAIVNKQDDNSYEEPVTDNTTKKTDTEKLTENKNDFEYAESGEFEDGTQLTDTNPKDDYL